MLKTNKLANIVCKFHIHLAGHTQASKFWVKTTGSTHSSTNCQLFALSARTYAWNNMACSNRSLKRSPKIMGTALAAVPMAMTIPDLVEVQKQYPNWQMELVDGSIVIMGPSDFASEEIGGRLLTFLNNWVMPRRLGRVTGSSAGFILPTLAQEEGEENNNNGETRDLRAPDVAFVRAKRLQRSKRDFVELVPDLAVEIKSKTDSVKKLEEKIQMFLKLGAEVGILIDPDKLTLTIYRSHQDPIVLKDGDTLTLPDLLPGWELLISELWPPEF